MSPEKFEFEVWYPPTRYNFSLDKEQVDVLVELSAVHYDFACWKASQVGGFLFGWANFPENINANTRELDTCLKIIEHVPPGYPQAKVQVVNKLRRFIHAMLAAA